MIPAAILERLPVAVRRCTWTAVPHPGFSGADVWCGKLHDIPLYACKLWPSEYDHIRLMMVHHAMTLAREAGLSFVPRVVAAGVVYQRCWDVTDWMPGRADYRTEPSSAKLKAACVALRQLHDVWQASQMVDRPYSVVHRLELLRAWDVRSMPLIDHPLFRTTLAQIQRWLPASRELLEAWDKPMPVQWCLRDIWHDHLLFDGDRVTGVLDYGAMRVDTPAVDLARMLGDLAGNREDSWELGFSHFPEIPRELINALDLAGLLGSANGWLMKWAQSGRLADRAQDRLVQIVHRLESFRVRRIS